MLNVPSTHEQRLLCIVVPDAPTEENGFIRWELVNVNN